MEKQEPDTIRRRTAMGLPVVLFTVYARTVMGNQMQVSGTGSLAPSGNPAGAQIIDPEEDLVE